MATKATTPTRTLLDPVFPIPAGAEEAFVHTDETVFVGNVVESDGLDLSASDETDDTADNASTGFEDGQYDDNVIDTPTDFVVFSQTLRRAPGGQQVVDIVIDVEDIGGAINYEFQVAKV